mmetsp:Transcript_9878/g.13923  ORF Transcript_9878/g.13923 Transcript_9878/m.13923 type:complete len:84 (-) Transcript_9878:198-449(-)
MHEYNVVQTGPKIESGGVQLGRFILRYHPFPLVALITIGVPVVPPITARRAQVTDLFANDIVGAAAESDVDFLVNTCVILVET